MTAIATKGDASLRVMAARVIAQQRWPYVSALLFSLRLVQVPHEELPTMAVDRGWRMYYSPQFVLGEAPEALATVLLHEAMHCLQQHADRFEALNQPPTLHPIWNIAGDAAINETLDAARMPWPSVELVRFETLSRYGVTPGMTTEGAFFALLDTVESDGTWWTIDCGSVGGGLSRGYELPVTDRTHPAVRSDQQAVVRDRVAHDILVRSRDHGDVPGGLLRWAQELLQPRIDWREALASRLRRDLAMVAGRRDYVYTRPSRRQDAMRRADSTVLLPSMRQPAPPRVAVVVDTSGSITDPDLRDFAAELVGIARASGVSSGVSVIPCDAQAHHVQRIRARGDVERLELPGGGGTDMGEGLSACADLRPVPHIVVVFTDGCTPWPESHPRGVDAVTVVLSDSLQEGGVPSWANVILLGDS
jgi:predicted metal-dependent peptidase